MYQTLFWALGDPAVARHANKSLARWTYGLPDWERGGTVSYLLKGLRTMEKNQVGEVVRECLAL